MAGVASSGDGVSTGNIPTGSIRWEVDKDSISTEGIYSHEIEVGGMQWELQLRKEGSDTEPYLYAYLNLVDGNYDVSDVDVSFEFELINHEDEDNTIYDEDTETLEQFDEACCFAKEWSDVFDEGKGFIKENKLTLQCDFSLPDIRGFRKIHRINFTDSNEPSHNIALIIEEEKIYVSKQFLSIHSPVFTSMFFGNFAEKDKNEVELKDVNRKEFIELLYVIYPPYKKITAKNFGYLLKLGDRFNINVIVTQCEQYLIDDCDMSVAENLFYAGQYRLIELQNHCLDKLTTSKEVKDLKNSSFFTKFTDAIYVALFHKIVNIPDES